MAIALMDMDGMTAEFMADTMMYYADVDADVDMIERHGNGDGFGRDRVR